MKNNYKNLFIAFAVLFLISATNRLNAQGSNALDFDGSNDFVTSPQGSSLIAGSSNISLAMWVYPRNAAPVFPDFDGFGGIRNNLDADFYILQYTATSVEARFINSAGTVHNIVSQGLQLNTWQHYALTYDGAWLRLYHNAQAVDSVAATGTITNANEMFYIGGMMYQTTNYYFNGKADEVALWNRTLTPSEIGCMYNNGADTSDAALKLYYRFNQGIPSGNNAGLNTLIDETGTSNGALNNFALTGNTSNWVGGVNNIVTYTDTICNGDSYTFNGQTYTSSGVYYAHFPLSSGCDSTVQLMLTVKPALDTLVLQNTSSLAAHATGVSYQWYNCSTGTIITGATSQLYTPTFTSNYAVIITQNGCTDTSGCHFFIVSGLIENNAQSLVSVFPNPASSNLYLNFTDVQKAVTAKMYDVSGKRISSYHFTSIDKANISIADLAIGVYFLEVITERATVKIPVYKL